MLRLRRFLLLGLLLAAVGLAPGAVAGPPVEGASGDEDGRSASAPTRAYAGRVGFTSHLVWLDPASQYRYLERAVAAGVTWFREDFAWSVMEPEEGVHDWSRWDTLMASAARLGANVLPVLGYAPAWANGGHADDKYPPLDPRDYADFALQVVSRYGPNGSFWQANPSLRPAPITVVELWNEPWLFAFWKPQPDPAAYNRLVRATAERLEAVRDDVRIMVSADWSQMRTDGRPQVGQWFPRLLDGDPALYRGSLVDLYAVHLYCEERSPRDAVTPQVWRYDRVLLSKQAADARGASKPFWNTEFGWSTYGSGDGVDEATQAGYVREALEIAVERWGSFLERSFVYAWERPANGSYVGAFNLMRDDGSLKPAFGEVRRLLAAGG